MSLIETLQKPVFGRLPRMGRPLSVGLVGCWSFAENPPKLGKVNDLSGNGNTGILVGDCQGVPGKFGPALDFDGTGDYVNVPGLASLSNNTWSVAALVNIDILPVEAATMVYARIIDTDDERIRFFINDIGTVSLIDDFVMNITSTDAVTTGKWALLVATYDFPNQNASIYVDAGIPVSDTDFNQATNSNVGDFRIGNRHNDLYFDGQMGNIMIWNRVLSASEIYFLYKRMFRMFGRDI